MPGRRCIAEVDGDLGILDPPGGTGVLPLNTGREDTLFEVARLIGDQHRRRVT